MTLNDFLGVADTDDMIEVYTKDGTTRPRELKLVNDFYVPEAAGKCVGMNLNNYRED